MSSPKNENEAREQRRLAAIMFTDIVGYTLLSQTDEKHALELLRQHRELLRPIFAKHHGSEVKTIGDAFLIEFSSALEATECSLEIQQALALQNSNHAGKLQIRIGIHMGEVVESQNDIYGDSVNIASRIEQLAEPGGICLTRQVYDLVKNKITDARMERLPIVQLKNVRTPIEVYKIVLPLSRRADDSYSVVHQKSDSNRVAILPFTNISSNPEDEYFADGLTEELISTMSKIRGLSIISRTSIMQYKNKAKPITDIGQELNVGTLLEGSVRRAGNRVRISVQMIDALQDKHLWAESYDREMADIFAVQSEIAGKVADALKVKLLNQEKLEMQKVPTKSPEAHTLFLKGLHHEFRGAPSDIAKAIEYYELALEQDPSFSVAYTRIADCYIGIGDESIPAKEAFPKAKDYVSKALSLDEKLAEARNCLAMIAYQYDWDWPGAEEGFRGAIELNPSLAAAHDWYGRFLASMGRFDEAIPEMETAVELDPLSPFVRVRFAWVHIIARNYERARQIAAEVTRQHPNFARAHMTLAILDALEGKNDSALRKAEHAVSISHDAFFMTFYAYVQATAGRPAEARKVLNDLITGKYGEYVSPVNIAQVQFALGEKEAGFESLEKGYLERSAGIVMEYNWPIFDSARDDPRFKEIVRRLNLSLSRMASKSPLDPSADQV